MSKFNFRKRLDSRVSVPISEEIFDSVRLIAKKESVNIPNVCAELLRVGLEEYQKTIK
jgi:hypothetical protein